MVIEWEGGDLSWLFNIYTKKMQIPSRVHCPPCKSRDENIWLITCLFLLPSSSLSLSLSLFLSLSLSLSLSNSLSIYLSLSLFLTLFISLSPSLYRTVVNKYRCNRSLYFDTMVNISEYSIMKDR